MGGDLMAAARQGLTGRQHHAFPQTLGGLQQRLQSGGIEAVVVGEKQFHERKARATASTLPGRFWGRDQSPPDQWYKGQGRQRFSQEPVEGAAEWLGLSPASDSRTACRRAASTA